jgi:hypothetical protein
VPRLRRRVAQENGDSTDETTDDSARYSTVLPLVHDAGLLILTYYHLVLLVLRATASALYTCASLQ